MGSRSPCEGAILREKRGRDMPGHVKRSIYSKRLSRGQHRYGADADWVTIWGAHWRHLANTIELSVCVSDANIMSNYFDHLLNLVIVYGVNLL